MKQLKEEHNELNPILFIKGYKTEGPSIMVIEDFNVRDERVFKVVNEAVKDLILIEEVVMISDIFLRKVDAHKYTKDDLHNSAKAKEIKETIKPTDALAALLIPADKNITLVMMEYKIDEKKQIIFNEPEVLEGYETGGITTEFLFKLIDQVNTSKSSHDTTH